MRSTQRIVTVTAALLAVAVAGCTDDGSIGKRSLAAGNAVKSQLRGYDLGPPFPAGFRDSGVINGYSEGEWIPFVAVIEGRKLEVADEPEGGIGDGTYRVALIVPTYSPRHNANGISELALTGTYGQGALTPIPDPFDDQWLLDNGYAPFVLGAYSDVGDIDVAPADLGAGQRTGPTRFGGDVSSASINVRFSASPSATRVELRFAVRLAPPGLEPIAPDGQGFPGTAPGGALGAADFHPGPGPLFVGYQVGEPTGIATVPIKVERHSCDSEEDCLPGEVCGEGGDCTEPCVTDAECPTDELCEDGTCQPPPPPCTEDEDCHGEETCVGGFCLPECPDTCADPELCDPDPCTPPDGDDPPPCVTDAQCPPADICEDGLCQPPDPPCDLSCPDDDICAGDVCVPPDTPCTDDFDCPGGEVCVGDVCEPGEPPCTTCTTCTDDSDCPGGTGCEGGFCVPLNPPVPCTDDTECSDGRTCEGGFCEPPPPPCGPTGECRLGELCEEGPNVCVPEHPPIPCSTPTDCPSGDECVGGWCTPPDDGGPGWPCKNAHDCDPGLTCEGHVCTPPDPPPCGSDVDCPAGDYCEGGVCVPPHPPIPCVEATDCPSGDECISGWCEPPTGCTRDEHCPGGELCEDGHCRPGDPPIPCTLDEDCPPTDDDVYVPVCEGGFCTPSGGDCGADVDCPGGMVCEDGHCIGADPPSGCETQFDCGGGELCEGGFCVPTDSPDECTTGDDCPRNPEDDVGPACVGGVCTTSRIVGTPCSTIAECEPGTTCSGGSCTPVSGACDLDGDCAGGSCIDGWCGAACSESTQCGSGEVCAIGRCAPPCETYLQCGVFEACYGSGCVPIHAVLARGHGGTQEAWAPAPNEGENDDVSGGCNVSGHGDPSPLVLLGMVLLVGIGLRRRPRPGALLALFAIALFACGDGGSSDDDDDSSADAAAPAADAAALADAGSGGDGGGSSSPFHLISCTDGPAADAAAWPDGGTMDAGASDAGTSDAGTVDAGPAADAGAPVGIDDVCCDPDGMCPGDLACIEGPGASAHRCRPRCDLTERDCPWGGVCADFGGQGVCIPASTEGQDCAPELCDAHTICVGSSADDATCKRRCETSDDCDDGQTCSDLNGSDAKACL